ncbi:hypothetical protein [Acidovorax sp. A1169]|uniref:hypothetical protein n=1 Tax=Acidovorax sp. A1169 TaxID=3059524 RepID=UPI002737E6AA|nr:hypothetical protein [Acidovorax sp. A1169]MDP4074002.1 hypothetical protein [Acidovorax sp. A1169]
MTAWNSPKHAEHQKAHSERKRSGLQAVAPAWQGLGTAKVQDAAKTAFKAVTWHHRACGSVDAQTFRLDLARAFAALVERQAGNLDAAAWLDAWSADMPASWTAQYPVYANPDEQMRAQSVEQA